MNVKLFLLTVLLFVSCTLYGQSKTTEKLAKKYSGSLTLFFYNNTLRMINQSESKEFDELVKDIEKMKLLVVKKESGNINYKEVVNDYRKESFSEIMTSRHQGTNFDIFLKEKNGETDAMLVLASDADNLYVLDIVGRIAFDKVPILYSFLDDSKDIGRRLKSFKGEMENEMEKKDSKEKE
jgi:hypothetical protein